MIVEYGIEEMFASGSGLKSRILKEYDGVYMLLCQFRSRVEAHINEGFGICCLADCLTVQTFALGGL